MLSLSKRAPPVFVFVSDGMVISIVRGWNVEVILFLKLRWIPYIYRYVQLCIYIYKRIVKVLCILMFVNGFNDRIESSFIFIHPENYAFSYSYQL